MLIKSIKKTIKMLNKETLYTFGGIFVFNATLQLIIYPLLNAYFKEDEFGIFIYFIGIISILAPAIGLSTNNTRIVLNSRKEQTNGDYIHVLIIGILCSLIIISYFALREDIEFVSVIYIEIAIFISILRYYSDVHYRQNMDYKRYFIYYCLLSFGYILGYFIAIHIDNIFIVPVIGESIAVFWVIINTDLYHSPLKCSPLKYLVNKECFYLMGSYLLSYSMMNLDRLVLKNMIGNEAVSRYYVLSLIGKSVAMIIAPVSTILIGKLSMLDKDSRNALYSRIIRNLMILALTFLIISIIGTPIFQILFYPNYPSESFLLILLVNLGQVFYFTGSLILVVVLTMVEFYWQLLIQISYVVIALLASICLCRIYGIEGFAFGMAIANIYRTILAIIVGIRAHKKS